MVQSYQEERQVWGGDKQKDAIRLAKFTATACWCRLNADVNKDHVFGFTWSVQKGN